MRRPPLRFCYNGTDLCGVSCNGLLRTRTVSPLLFPSKIRDVDLDWSLAVLWGWLPARSESVRKRLSFISVRGSSGEPPVTMAWDKRLRRDMHCVLGYSDRRWLDRGAGKRSARPLSVR